VRLQPARYCVAAGLPIGATWVSPREPVSGRSYLPAAKAACALPDRCVEEASVGESDEFRAVEIRQSPAAKPSSGPATVDSICNALAAAVEVDDPTGWERLIPAGISDHNVLPTAEAALTRIRAAPRGARRNQKTA
jgi:hypothetical protein